MVTDAPIEQAQQMNAIHHVYTGDGSSAAAATWYDEKIHLLEQLNEKNNLIREMFNRITRLI